MTGATLNATLFLISIVFDSYLVVLFLRILLVLKHADYYHPLTQFVTRITDIFVKPLKKVLPTIRRFETATLVLMLIVAVLKNLLVSIMTFGLHNPIGLFILALSNILSIILSTFIVILILQSTASWMQPGSQIYYTFANVTDPFMKYIRKILPPLAGVDFSPFVAIVILLLLVIMLVNPLEAYGIAITNGTISLL